MITISTGDATYYGLIPLGTYYNCWSGGNCRIISGEASAVDPLIPFVALLNLTGILLSIVTLRWKKTASAFSLVPLVFLSANAVFIPAALTATRNLCTVWETYPATTIQCITFPVGTMNTPLGVLSWGFSVGFYSSLVAGSLALVYAILLHRKSVT